MAAFINHKNYVNTYLHLDLREISEHINRLDVASQFLKNRLAKIEQEIQEGRNPIASRIAQLCREIKSLKAESDLFNQVQKTLKDKIKKGLFFPSEKEKLAGELKKIKKGVEVANNKMAEVEMWLIEAEDENRGNKKGQPVQETYMEQA